MKKKPMTAAERKRRQRERDKALGVDDMRLSTTAAERKLVELMAELQGYEDRCEYVMSLVAKDCDTSLNLNSGSRDIAAMVKALEDNSGKTEEGESNE